MAIFIAKINTTNFSSRYLRLLQLCQNPTIATSFSLCRFLFLKIIKFTCLNVLRRLFQYFVFQYYENGLV